MLFVHIADARAVPRIKKNGLVMKPGRLGKGIYCVPAMRMLATIEREINVQKQYIYVGEEDEHVEFNQDLKCQISSERLWRWLFRNHRPHKSRRTVLALFRLRGEAVKGKLLLRHGGITLEIIGSESALIKLIRDAKVCNDGRYSATGDDKFEFVLHSNVKPKNIIKCIPINKTKATYKKRKENLRANCREY